MILKIINEASRNDLLTKSRRGDKVRFSKRLNYQVSNFKGVDLSELFEHDYFVFNTPINEYVCTLAFPGVLTELREVAKATKGDATKINLQLVIKALRRAFDKTDDVKVRCTCADFKYRFMYWANRYGYLYGSPDAGTEEFPEKTNPDDSLGATCKHLDLFLSNKRWLTKAASVVNALIKTYPDKAAVYLYNKEDIIDKEEEPEEEIPQDNVEEPVDDKTDNKVDKPFNDRNTAEDAEEVDTDEENK